MHLPIHTILHGTDFSERSKSAFALACAVARDYEARLVVLHVKPPRMAGGEVHALITRPQLLIDLFRTGQAATS
jgi:nucleotide-binding universal stress UspA family protein